MSFYHLSCWYPLEVGFPIFGLGALGLREAPDEEMEWFWGRWNSWTGCRILKMERIGLVKHVKSRLQEEMEWVDPSIG